MKIVSANTQRPSPTKMREAHDKHTMSMSCSTFLLCSGATICVIFAIFRLLQDPIQPFGYDSEGAVWNMRVAQLIGTEGSGGQRAAEALMRAQRECAGAHSRMPHTFRTDVVLSTFLTCGSVILQAGLVPGLRADVISQVADFSRAILDEGQSGEWKADDVLPPPHSDKRGDLWPPFAVFGQCHAT